MTIPWWYFVALLLMPATPFLCYAIDRGIERRDLRLRRRLEREHETWRQPITDIESIFDHKRWEREFLEGLPPGRELPEAIRCSCRLDLALEAMKSYGPDSEPFAVYAALCPVHGLKRRGAAA